MFRLVATSHRLLPNTCHVFQRTLIVPRTIGPQRLSAEEAVSFIESGDHIYLHSAASFPRILADALAQRGKEEGNKLSDISLYHLHVEGPDPLEHADISPQPFRSRNFFVGKSSREAVNEGRSTYVPCFLSDIPRLIRNGRPKLDWTLLNVSPPDRHGYCSLGPEVCAALPAAECSAKVIAQINPNVPRTHGHSFIHVNAFDYVVDVGGNPLALLPELAVPEIGEADMAIGRVIAELIPDGACLQVGIGAIPNAVLSYLKNHRYLGIHSEMFSDGVMDLLQSGAVDNTQKSFLQGRTVTAFLVGSRELYDFVNDNPGIHLDEASVTNSPVIISRNKKVVAINSALEVDLTGQVCADSVGTRMISGVGGQLDFVRGAALSDGGFPIICLRSTTKKHQSTIVGTLKLGAGITTSRYHAHWIVTEFGAVNLWGKDLVERARAMISIAHPDHRESLAREAFDRFKVLV